MTKNRDNIVAVITGNRGTGKSTFLDDIIKDHPKKVLIYDMDDNPIYSHYQIIEPEQIKVWKRGVKVIIDVDYDKVIDEMTEHLYNTLIVLEDATKYIDSDPKKAISRLILASKQRNLDIILTFHTYRSAPPKVLSWGDYLQVFKTDEEIKQFKSKIPKYSTVKNVYDRIQASENRYLTKTVKVR